jgi:hypothetical protein
MRTLKSFYVKYERKLRECVRDFCLYCRHHRKKTAVCYYDSAALGNNCAVNDEDFRTAVCDEFEKQGWDVIPVYTGKPVKHMEKWLPISRAFKGQSGLFPHAQSGKQRGAHPGNGTDRDTQRAGRV